MAAGCWPCCHRFCVAGSAANSVVTCVAASAAGSAAGCRFHVMPWDAMYRRNTQRCKCRQLPSRHGFPSRHPYEHDDERYAFPIWLLLLASAGLLPAATFMVWHQLPCTEEAQEDANATKRRFPTRLLLVLLPPCAAGAAAPADCCCDAVANAPGLRGV